MIGVDLFSCFVASGVRLCWPDYSNWLPVSPSVGLQNDTDPRDQGALTSPNHGSAPRRPRYGFRNHSFYKLSNCHRGTVKVRAWENRL